MALSPDKTYTANGVKVNEYLLTKHNPNGIDMPWATISNYRGVTIHNTDFIRTAASTTPAEQYTRATVNGNMGSVRVHYYVDDVCAWQNLPDNRAGWHAADGDGDGNRKTIAIECIMGSGNSSWDAKSEDNCARLAAYLLKKIGKGVDCLYRHSDWYSGKTCPLYIIPHWAAFKAKVQGYMNATTNVKTASTPQSLNATASDFKTGDTVYVKKGAVDANGKSASAIYAGANNPLVIKTISGEICTLYKGTAPIYRMAAKYLSKTPDNDDSVLVPGSSKVKLVTGAVWWGTNTTPPQWVFNTTYYLQSWDTVTGRAVIGTTPKSSSTTTTGAIDIKYLVKA